MDYEAIFDSAPRNRYRIHPGVRAEAWCTNPQTEPTAYDAARRFKAYAGKDIKDRHLSSNSQCCLWLPPLSPLNSADSNASRDFINKLFFFWDRQLIYDDNGKWPGPAYEHEWHRMHFPCDRKVGARMGGTQLKYSDKGI